MYSPKNNTADCGVSEVTIKVTLDGKGIGDGRGGMKYGNNYFLTWISAQVKEMGGFVFRNCEIHFSRVFWVRNK